MRLKIHKGAVKQSDNVLKAVDRFNAAFDSLNTVLVARGAEISALKLAILAGENLMIHGDPGLGKSLLVRQAFERITGARLFFKQLLSGTQPDEVIGCMNTEVYRKEARWEYNVTGMLPDCHFAFLDEVYRASKSFLPSMMQVLNERTFFNGLEEVKCPLITAVGTTNFKTDDPELNAFHDRWLINIHVTPMASVDSRIALLNLHWNRQKTESKLTSVTLEDIKLLQKAVREFNFDTDMVSFYEEFSRKYSAAAKVTISDRRLCQSLRLIAAQALMDRQLSCSAAHIAAVAGAFIDHATADSDQHFTNIFDQVIGSRLQEVTMGRRLKKLYDLIIEKEKEFDPEMPSEELADTFKWAYTIEDSLSDASFGLSFSQGFRDMLSQCRSKVASLRVEAEKHVRASIVKEVKEEQQPD